MTRIKPNMPLHKCIALVPVLLASLISGLGVGLRPQQHSPCGGSTLAPGQNETFHVKLTAKKQPEPFYALITIQSFRGLVSQLYYLVY